MSNGFYRIKKGLGLTPATLPTTGRLGDLACDPTGKIKEWNGSAWVDVINSTDSQVLTNKDIDGGTASNTSRITLPKASKTTLDGLTRKEGTIVYASDEDKVYYDDGTTLKAVGTGTGGGGVNFITNGDAENGTTGWATYDEGFSPYPVDGTGGTPSVISFSTTSTNPLAGTNSFLITKTGSNALGEGVSYDFTIDAAYKAKVLNISFDYIVASGTFEAKKSTTPSSIIAYIYDVTNSQLIEPSSISLLSNSTTISDKFSASFQTSATGTQYRLILHCARTSSDTWTLKLDNISVSPSNYVYGTPITDWESYSFTPVTSSGTMTNYTATMFSRRVGSELEARFSIAFTGAPGTWSGVRIPIKSGLTIDTAKTPDYGDSKIFGQAGIIDTGANYYVGTVNGFNTSQLIVYWQGTSTHTGNAPAGIFATTSTSPMTFVSGDGISGSFSVPILGWSSSVQVSDGYDGRVVAASAMVPANQSVANATDTKITYTNIQSNTTNSLSNSTFTVPSAGTYRIEADFAMLGPADAGIPGSISIKIDGVTAKTLSTSDVVYSQKLGSLGDRSPIFSISLEKDLKAGQTVEIYGIHYCTTSTGPQSATVNAGSFSIEKLSGSPTISASETVAFSGKHTSGLSIPRIVEVPVDFNINTVNTHGSYRAGAGYNSSTGTWTTIPGFVANSAGLYFSTFNAFFANATITAGNEYNVSIKQYRGGTLIDEVKLFDFPTGTATTFKGIPTISYTHNLIAGDELRFTVYHNESAAKSLHTFGTNVTVTKVK